MNRHCEQCSKVLKDRVTKSLKRQERFCSRLCSIKYIAENRLTSTLTEEQEVQIVRLKERGAQNQLIANLVGCTIGQVRHYCYYWKSPGRAKRNTERYRLRIDAREALAAEIAAAKAEMATAKPFKVGLLGEW